MIDLSEFKPYPKDNRYLVSKDGRVYSTIKKKILNTHITNRGYVACSIKPINGVSTRLVHKIVADTFLLSSSIGRIFVNHIDGNKLNPAVENLEFVTPLENSFHAKIAGLMKHRKFSHKDIEEIFFLYGRNVKIKDIAEIYKSDHSYISDILKGNFYNELGNIPYNKLINKSNYSDEKKIECRKLYELGNSRMKISNLLGIGLTSVYNFTR